MSTLQTALSWLRDLVLGVREPRHVVLDAPLPLGARAAVLYPVILYSGPADRRDRALVGHELYHFYRVRRFAQWAGPLSPLAGVLGWYLLYLLIGAALLVKGGRDASDHPMEATAYWLEGYIRTRGAMPDEPPVDSLVGAEAWALVRERVKEA